jgi:hypothetical protein
MLSPGRVHIGHAVPDAGDGGASAGERKCRHADILAGLSGTLRLNRLEHASTASVDPIGVDSASGLTVARADRRPVRTDRIRRQRRRRIVERVGDTLGTHGPEHGRQ